MTPRSFASRTLIVSGPIRRLLISGLSCILVYFAYSRCTFPIPTASTFQGPSGGCGDFFVYRFNHRMTLAVTVSVDEKGLLQADGAHTFPISSTDKHLAVEVLQFRQPATSYFCDDVAGDAAPMTRWRAMAGKLHVAKITESPRVGNATHRVSVELRNVVFQQEGTSNIATIDVLDINDVWVGWYPG